MANSQSEGDYSPKGKNGDTNTAPKRISSLPMALAINANATRRKQQKMKRLAPATARRD